MATKTAKTTTTKAATTKKTAENTKSTVSTTVAAETPVVVTTDETTVTTAETIVSIPEPEVVTVKEKKTFTDSDYILCRSVWSGGLNITSQSGNLYEFTDYGSECEINYRDLVTLIRRGSDHVFMPRFVILDDDFLEDFPTVRKVYGEMYTMDDLKNILELPVSQMSIEISKLPNEIRDHMKTLIATQIANGKLDSIAKVRELSSIFNSDFNLLSDLFVK